MKKKFKSLLAIFLVLAFVLTGCGNAKKDSGKSSDSGSKQESSTGKKVNEENKGNIVGEKMGGGVVVENEGTPIKGGTFRVVFLQTHHLKVYSTKHYTMTTSTGTSLHLQCMAHQTLEKAWN